MRILQTLTILALAAMIVIGCEGKKEKENLPVVIIDNGQEIEGDTTVFGECVDAAMNSLSLLTSAGDTIEYIFSSEEGDADVQGGQFMGDKMAVIGYETAEANVARKVVNLTSLMGRWVSLDKNFEIKEGGVVESSVAAESNPYTSWKIFNGRLILSKDTFDIVSLSQDSLLLENDNGIYAYKRQL